MPETTTNQSKRIDQELAAEAKAKRISLAEQKELDILLLGPSGAGKSTFVRQMRFKYDAEGIAKERLAFRHVIFFSLVTTIKLLLSLLGQGDNVRPANYDDDDDGSSSVESAPSSAPSPQDPLVHRLRNALAPILGLETSLRETLGGLESGPTAGSLRAHARRHFQDGVEEAAWGDPPRPGDVGDRASLCTDKSLKKEHQRRGAGRERLTEGPTPGDGEVLLKPLGALAQRESPTVRQTGAKAAPAADSQSSCATSTTLVDVPFAASADDPVRVLEELKEEVDELWKEVVQRGLIAGKGPLEEKLGGGFELSESAIYFLEAFPRIIDPSWVPTDEDLLNVRVRTVGIEEIKLQISKKQVYRICDVAGARGTKHAWAYVLSVFDLFFIVALSDYSVADPQDPTVNRLADALELFEDVAKNPLLSKVVFIVFMNKTDLLRKKLHSGHYPLQKYFSGYHGGLKTSGVLHFFQRLFEECHASRKDMNLYVFATQTNDQSVRFVISAVK
ncbi:hypothetical protein JCM1840_005386 [Sporobolomyces johnsonii]